ncbi:MAG: hypothetical protein RQ736_04925 [Thiogranum sp.]|nr:hypothetical protein [Thiogranum sp.]
MQEQFLKILFFCGYQDFLHEPTADAGPTPVRQHRHPTNLSAGQQARRSDRFTGCGFSNKMLGLLVLIVPFQLLGDSEFNNKDLSTDRAQIVAIAGPVSTPYPAVQRSLHPEIFAYFRRQQEIQFFAPGAVRYQATCADISGKSRKEWIYKENLVDTSCSARHSFCVLPSWISWFIRPDCGQLIA